MWDYPKEDESDGRVLGARIPIEKTLEDRGKNYGEFPGVARISQNIKNAMQQNVGYRELRPIQKEALEMMANKMGRIINGDPDYADSWHDIGGYAELVVKFLEKE